MMSNDQYAVDPWGAAHLAFILMAVLFIVWNYSAGQVWLAAGNALVAIILAGSLVLRWTTPPERRSP